MIEGFLASIAFGLISFFVLLTSAFLFQRASGSLSLSKLNLVSWIFYFQLVLLCFIGVNLSLFGTYHYIMSRASAASLQLTYAAVCYVLIVMPISMIVVQRFISRKGVRHKLVTYYRSALTPLQSQTDSTQRTFWFLMTLTAFLATAYVYAYTRSLPFLALVSGDDAYATVRREAASGFGGNVYVRNFLALILSQLVSYIAFAYLLMKKSILYLTWFGLTFVTAVMAVTYSGEKAPLLNYLIGLFLVFGVSRSGFKKRYLAAIALVATTLIAVIYLSIGQLSLALNSGPIGRILMTQIAGLPLYFDYFPQLEPFLRGASFPEWLSSLFGLEHVRPSRIVMTYVNPVGVAEGRAGVMNTLFIGEAWANFGWLGFFASPIIVGAVIQFLHNLFLSLPKAPIYLGTMVYFMLQVPITGGFVDFLWNSGWLFLFLLLSSSLFARPLLMGAKRSSLEA